MQYEVTWNLDILQALLDRQRSRMAALGPSINKQLGKC